MLCYSHFVLNLFYNDLEDIKDNNIDLLSVYPIGSIYISYSSTNPSTLFGGIWEQIQGKFLLGVSSSYTVGNTSVTSSSGGNGNTGSSSASSTGSSSGSTGGSSSANTGSTTLTINQIPAHTHNYTYVGFKQIGEVGGNVGIFDPEANRSVATTSTGGSQGHTHTMAHTHSISNHTHTMAHTHSIGSHTHTVNTLPPYIAVYMWKRTA